MLKGSWICAAVMVALFAVAPSSVVGQGAVDTVRIFQADSLSDRAMLELARERLISERSIHNSMITWTGIVVALLLVVNVGSMFWLVKENQRQYSEKLSDAKKELTVYTDEVVGEATEQLRLQAEEKMTLLIQVYEVLTSASHHSIEASMLITEYARSCDEGRPAPLLASRAASAAATSLGTVMQVHSAMRKQPPWLYLVRSALAGLSECSKIVPAESLSELAKPILSNALDKVRGDNELWASQDIRAWVEEIDKWQAGGDSQGKSPS
ncbi:MAG: hypothetical protein ABIK83_05485 [Candidatus Zixiibacteriota bacterium]